MEEQSENLEDKAEFLSMTVNGEAVDAEVPYRLKLSDFLRYDGNCSSVRVGCEHGSCGACTVLVDGERVKSCLQFAVQADGSVVETMEGVSEDGKLHPIQEAFRNQHALQCGFCTSGFVMATKALLDDTPSPTREEIEDRLSANICRCTGYVNIIDAVEDASSRLDNR